jgi:hypothetical protein
MKKFLFFIPILLVSCLNSDQVDKETLPITSVDSTKEEVFFIDSSSTTNGDGDGSSGGSYSDNNEIHDDSVYTESSNESNVDLGRILYVVPDTMYVMKNYEIVIRISNSQSNNLIFQNLERQMIRAESETRIIRTTGKMQVELIDPQKSYFNITSINSNKQLVDSTFTEWKFNVQPIKSGTNRLDLVVSIFIEDDIKQISYSDEIYVRTNPKAQIADFWFTNWKWILEKLILPLITWFIGYWMGKKKK